MIFRSLNLTKDGYVMAEAKGHPTAVVEAFWKVSDLLLGGRGRWRITEVRGFCTNDNDLDSEMEWVLHANLKEKGIS